MGSEVKERFAAEASADVLSALRKIAQAQGRQFESLVDEALQDYLDRQQTDRPRGHVMAAFSSSTNEFDALYQDLAK